MVISCSTFQNEEKEYIWVKQLIYAVLSQFQMCRNLRVFSRHIHIPKIAEFTKNVFSQVCPPLPNSSPVPTYPPLPNSSPVPTYPPIPPLPNFSHIPTFLLFLPLLVFLLLLLILPPLPTSPPHPTSYSYFSSSSCFSSSSSCVSYSEMEKRISVPAMLV